MKRLPIPNLRAYVQELRSLGFKKDHEDAQQGHRVITYSAQMGNRVIDVQLWHDGQHRASHMLEGRGDTSPTPFTTLEHMLPALLFEATRVNHPRWKGKPTEEALLNRKTMLSFKAVK